MSELSSGQSYDEFVNEELRSYEGFPAILSVVERFKSDRADQPEAPLLERKMPHFVIPTDDPELAELIERLRAMQEARRAKVLSVLFPSPDVTGSKIVLKCPRFNGFHEPAIGAIKRLDRPDQ